MAGSSERVGVALRASGGQIRHFVIKFSLILREFERLYVMMRLQQRLLALQDFQARPRLEGDGVLRLNIFIGTTPSSIGMYRDPSTNRFVRKTLDHLSS